MSCTGLPAEYFRANARGGIDIVLTPSTSLCGRKESTVKRIVDSLVALSRVPESSLEAHIEPFLRSLSEEEYPLDSIQRPSFRLPERL
jgi:hypothetical protein